MKKIISKILAAALVMSTVQAYPAYAEEGISEAVLVEEEQDSPGNENVDGILGEDLEEAENDGAAVLEDSSADEEVKNFEGFEYKLLENGTVEITGSIGKETKDLIIPDSIEGRDVTRIGSYTF